MEHGGKREGAGRKGKGEEQKINRTLNANEWNSTRSFTRRYKGVNNNGL